MRDQCGFCVCIPVHGTPRLVNVSLSNRDFTPLIPPEVDQNADEPRLLVREAGWNRLRGVSGLQKRFLNEIQSVIGRRSKTPRQTVEPLIVSIEQRGQPIRRRNWQAGRQGSG